MRIGKRRISKKLLLIVVPIVVVLVGAGAAYAAVSFPDISGHWAEQSILRLAERGVVQGHDNGTFGPDEPVTRAQVVTFLDRFGSKMGCTDCHDDTTKLTGKKTAWEESNHGMNESYLRATSASCAGCHSGGAFSVMVAAGKMPNQATADPEPTRQDCRACHEIHETYTGVDWALETTAAVPLFAIAGSTFDGGKGNLCATCHQPRRNAPVATNGVITGISEHWGPHHGPQSAMMLGVGGAGPSVAAAALTGAPMAHYTLVSDTCVSCHMGNDQHSFAPAVAACQSCHPGAEDFDINGVQTAVQDRLDAIADALIAAGALTENTVDGHPTEEAIENGLPENIGTALYNWLYIAHEDKSLGVHNPAYTRALLDAAEEALDL